MIKINERKISFLTFTPEFLLLKLWLFLFYFYQYKMNSVNIEEIEEFLREFKQYFVYCFKNTWKFVYLLITSIYRNRIKTFRRIPWIKEKIEKISSGIQKISENYFHKNWIKQVC